MYTTFGARNDTNRCSNGQSPKIQCGFHNAKHGLNAVRYKRLYAQYSPITLFQGRFKANKMVLDGVVSFPAPVECIDADIHDTL